MKYFILGLIIGIIGVKMIQDGDIKLPTIDIRYNKIAD